MTAYDWGSLLVFSIQVMMALLAAYRPDWAPQGQGATYAAVGANFSLMSILLALQIVKIEKASTEAHKSLSESLGRNHKSLADALPNCRIDLLPGHQFYPDFLSAASSASGTVYISYLAPYAPDEGVHKERKDYYSDIIRVMKTNKNCRFRRLLRFPESDDFKKWVTNHLQSLEGVPNVDVALLPEPAGDPPLALSVQVVDESTTWLVAVSDHEQKGKFRDVRVCNPDFSAAMARYYDRLWGRATVVLKSGKLTDMGRSMLTSPPAQDKSSEKPGKG